MAEPIRHHRTPEFKEIFASCRRDLSPLFATAEPVLMLASTGTGAMEASITNMNRAGDTIITIAAGKFGERWGEIGRAYGLNVIELSAEWGRSISVKAVQEALDAHPGVRGVYLQASETSTGASHPVKAIAALCRERAHTLCVVDGITAVGVQPVEMDAWGIDVVISGSQKAFMLPPGLAFIALSEKARKRTEEPGLPRYYFNLAKEATTQAKGQTAWTSAVSLIVGLRQVINRMNTMGGLTALHAHHERLARATRAGLTALGLELLAETPSWSVTAAYTPESIGAGLVIADLNKRGIRIAGGQNHLKDRIIRIGHLGWFSPHDITATLSALEDVLHAHGHSAAPGCGVAAACRELNATTKAQD